MNARHIPLMVLAVLALSFSCIEDSSGPFDGGTDIISGIDRAIDIRIDHSVFIRSERLTVTFTDVIESRCPRGAICIWEGEGIAELRLRTSDRREAVIRPTIRPGMDPERFPWLTAYAFGLKITLLELEPYPDVDLRYDRSRCRARLLFELVGDPAPCRDVEFDEDPAGRCADPLWFDDVSIDGDRLVVALRHSGGCGDHEFALFADRGFAKTNPPSIDCRFVHYDLGDLCEAIVPDTACFDLRRIGELCDGIFHGCDEIVINVYECDPSGTGEMRTVRWIR